MSVAEVSMKFGTDAKSGKREESASRKSKNSIFVIPSIPTDQIIKDLASDLMPLLLTVVYCISALTGSVNEAVAGILASAAVFILGCYIKYRSSKRISNSYRLLLPTVKITENGIPKRLSVFDVEVGDLIHFARGDIIPADARVVFAASLKVAERSVDPATGKTESISYEKNTDTCNDSDELAVSHSNMVYAGTLVTSGKGSAIVTAIGKETRLAVTGQSVKVVPENDAPEFLTSFVKETKAVSLAIVAALIPACIVSIYRLTKSADAGDFFADFLLLIALAFSCMSNIVTIPAEALVTKEILPSSRIKILNSRNQSRITKLAATEKLANTKAVVLLSADALIDTAIRVRQIYFSGSSFAFDSLYSTPIREFSRCISPAFANVKRSSLNTQERAVRSFLHEFKEKKRLKDKDEILFPSIRDSSRGLRICILEKDDRKNAKKIILQSEDTELLKDCDLIREENGSIGVLNVSVRENAIEWYNARKKTGQNVFLVISAQRNIQPNVFEGMIAVGCEYPYADGHDDIRQTFIESGIKPIVILGNEAKFDAQTVIDLGIVESERDIVYASDVAKMGLKFSQMRCDASAYIGFGKSDTQALIKRLKSFYGNTFYIIKDSANKLAIGDDSVYAIHNTASHDTVKIGASLSLRPVDATSHIGGLTDALDLVKRSAMSYLKLGVYRNYLIFSLLIRVICVCVPILFDFPAPSMSSAMIIIGSFMCDYLALLAFMYSNGLPVRPKDTVDDAKRLFSRSLYAIYALFAAFSAGSILFIAFKLFESGMLTPESSPWFVMYAFIASSVASVGALSVVLMKRARRFAFNFAYTLEVLFIVALLITQAYLPDSFFTNLSFLSISRVGIFALLFTLIPAVISFVSVLTIDKLLQSMSFKRP